MIPDPGDSQADSGVQLLHRRRDNNARPAWNAGDVAIAASLVALLLPAWLMPERLWRGFCRLVVRLSRLVDRDSLAATAKSIALCLPAIGSGEAMCIARDLQAAVYELRLQNLRTWRPGSAWHPRIALYGGTYLTTALASGHGAILWIGHFAFNSNVTKIALAEFGHPIAHMSRPEHGFSKTRFGLAWLNPVRCVPEDRHLSERIVFDRRNPAAAMRRMIAVLGGNGALSITAGAWEGSDLAEGALYGGRLSLALGAPRLAAHTGATLLPVFTVREHDGTYRVVIEPPIDVPANLPRRQAECAAVQDYLARHEPWVMRYPEQWRGWKEWRPA